MSAIERRPMVKVASIDDYLVREIVMGLCIAENNMEIEWTVAAESNASVEGGTLIDSWLLGQGAAYGEKIRFYFDD